MFNVLWFGFYLIRVKFDGSCEVIGAHGNSSLGYASRATSFKTFTEAHAAVLDWSLFIWNNNDRSELIAEYNLTPEFVEGFLRHSWPAGFRPDAFESHFMVQSAINKNKTHLGGQ